MFLFLFVQNFFPATLEMDLAKVDMERDFSYKNKFMEASKIG
jgi:hypothetical protein